MTNKHKGYVQCGVQRYDGCGIAVAHNFRTEGYVDALLERNQGKETSHGPAIYDIYLSKTRHQVPEQLELIGSCNMTRLGRITDLTKSLESRMPNHDLRKKPRRVRIIRDEIKSQRVRIHAEYD